MRPRMFDEEEIVDQERHAEPDQCKPGSGGISVFRQTGCGCGGKCHVCQRQQRHEWHEDKLLTGYRPQSPGTTP